MNIAREQFFFLAAVGSLGLLVWGLDLLGGMIGLEMIKGKRGKLLHWSENYIKYIGERAALIGLILALGATSGSLFVSEVLLFAPCKLCWLQRIFMYSMVPIFAIAVGKKDKNVFEYGLVLAMIGGAMAIYQYLLQLGVIAVESCGVSGVSCSERLVNQFGFVTIPFMSLGVFVAIGAVMAAGMRTRDQATK